MEITQDFSHMTNEELLDEYMHNRSREIKEELTLRYIPLVRQIAKQMWNVYSNFSQIDDIINEGVFVIMTALDRYEVDKNVKFESYVVKRLRGMIIDIARKQDWLTRGERKIAKNMENVRDRLYECLERPPTDEEVAGELGITLKHYYEQQQRIALFNMISLDLIMDETADKKWKDSVPVVGEESDPELQSLRNEKKDCLRRGIEALGENERLVISLYYEQELSIKEIAGVLEVSKPRISQIHINALKKLKTYMEENW